MSLDTTLLCTVRQKTSLKDKFLGLVSIPLSTFTISSKPVTHWYKLGAKAGKTSSKLRGELLLSIKFLSNWVAEEPDIIDFSFGSEKDQEIKKQKKLRTKSVKFSSSSSPLGFRRRGMLKRTKSEMRQRGGSDASADSTNSSGSSGAVGETDGKKKEKSKFRLSIKKKARSPVLEECSDEFMSLSLPLRTESSTSSVSSPSQTLSPLQGEGERDMFDGTGPPSEPLSRSLDSKSVPNGHSTTDVGEGGGGEGREMGGKDGEKQTPKTERMVCSMYVRMCVYTLENAPTLYIYNKLHCMYFMKLLLSHTHSATNCLTHSLTHLTTYPLTHSYHSHTYHKLTLAHSLPPSLSLSLSLPPYLSPSLPPVTSTEAAQLQKEEAMEYAHIACQPPG